NAHFLFFMLPATTEIYTLSLHDALPISAAERGRPAARARSGAPVQARVGGSCPASSGGPGWTRRSWGWPEAAAGSRRALGRSGRDRKSTRLNSSHVAISYAVFCLKKKRE